MIAPKAFRASILMAIVISFAFWARAQGGNPSSPVQSFTVLYTFQPTDPITGTNANGANPNGNMVLSGHILYGSAGRGGTNDGGTIFAFNTGTNGLTSQYCFTATDPQTATNTDGAVPKGVLLSGNTLYGSSLYGGSFGNGTLFAVNTDGTGFTNLYSFSAADPETGTNNDGAGPNEGLILAGDTLYGTCLEGGTNGNGTVFAVKTNGTNFKTLYSFSAIDPEFQTNTDGAQPGVGLLLSGSTLYGTAWYGGYSGDGTIFAINTNGAGFTNLWSFNYEDGGFPGAPPGPLILAGNTFFGTTEVGGTNGNGSVFAIDINGGSFTDLHDFSTNHFDGGGNSTNADGIRPGDLLLVSGLLYGATVDGGRLGNGTLFSINTNGTAFSVLHHFAAGNYNGSGYFTNNDGVNPVGNLVQSGNILYGKARNGGLKGSGTLFSLASSLVSAPAIDSLSLSGSNLVINAVNGVSGSTNQVLTATNLTLPLNQWTPMTTNILGGNGNFTVTVTNTVSPSPGQRFYILQLR